MRKLCFNLALILLAITFTLSVQTGLSLAADAAANQTLQCIPDPYSDNPLENIHISSPGTLAPQSTATLNQPLYQAIMTAMLNLEDEINVATLLADPTNSQEVFDTREMVLNDHPEIFYFTHKTSPYYTDGRLVFGYQYEKAAIPQMKSALTAKANAIIQQCVKPEDSSWQKEKALHDYLVLHAAYDEQAPENLPYEARSAYGIIMNEIGVCAGYAKAMKLLLDQIDVECILITGEAGDDQVKVAHMWNMVNIDSQWYHLDVTWDDPVPDIPGQIGYSFFNVTDTVMENNSHTWTAADYPPATSTRFAYLQDMVHPVLYNGFFYYSNKNDGYKLYTCAIDGSNLHKLNEAAAQYLAVYQDWIYFSNYSYGGYLHKIKIDGTGLSSLNEILTKNIIIQDGWLHYIDQNTAQLYTMCVDTNQQPQITLDGSLSQGLSPIVKNSCTLLPLSETASLLGLQSTPNGTEIRLQKGSTQLTLQLGSTSYQINGTAAPDSLPAAPQTINEQTMLPLAGIAGKFGYAVYTTMPNYVDILTPQTSQRYTNAFCVGSPLQDYKPENLTAVSYGWISLIPGSNTNQTQLQLAEFPANSSVLLQAAQQNNTRRLISIWCNNYNVFGPEINKTVLSGQLYDFLYGRISIDGMNVSDYSGVVIDFEGFPEAVDTSLFPAWLDKVGTILHAKGIGLSVCLPVPRYQGSRFNYPAISQAADEIILMAHDYADRSTPSPDSPLSLINEDIQTLLDQFVPANKILLQLSLANVQYKEVADQPTVNRELKYHPSLNTINNTISQIKAGTMNGTILEHSYTDGSSKLVFERPETNVTINATTYSDALVKNTIYYLDEKGLAARFKLISQHGLKGLSFWKLGINGISNPGPWSVINMQAPRWVWQNPNPASSDASLSNLLINGQSISGFSPGTINYTLTLPAESPLPTVTANKNHCQAGEPVINMPSTIPGPATIQVTAEDGTLQTYTVNLEYIDECFIATAAFGSKFEPAVVLLRQFRDQFLLSNKPGTAFVNFYYHNSPPIARMIAQSEPLKIGVRILLTPIIAIVYMFFHPVLALIMIITGFMLVTRFKKIQLNQLH